MLTNDRVSHKYLSDGRVLAPSRVSTWCRGWVEQLVTRGGAANSSCQHNGIYNSLAHSYAPILIFTVNHTQACIKWLLRWALKGKLCRVYCTRTMTQCMSLHAPDQGFPNSVEGWGKFFRGEFNLYVGGNLRISDLTISTLFKVTNNNL